MKNLCTLPLALALFALAPTHQVLAEEGDRSCGDCACGGSNCVVIGWEENQYGNDVLTEIFEDTWCLTPENECEAWIDEDPEPN